MSEKVTCGGYIYKWGTKVGCTDYTIPEEVFKKGASEEMCYPVTDGSFLRDDPWSVLGTCRLKFDENGVWTDISLVSEPAKEAVLEEATFEIEERKLKLGFMINNVQKSEISKTVTSCRLSAVDIAECAIHPIEYVRIVGEEIKNGTDENLSESESNEGSKAP